MLRSAWDTGYMLNTVISNIRTLEGRNTATYHPFMPILPIAQARLAVKSAQNCPWYYEFCSVRGCKRWCVD